MPVTQESAQHTVGAHYMHVEYMTFPGHHQLPPSSALTVLHSKHSHTKQPPTLLVGL